MSAIDPALLPVVAAREGLGGEVLSVDDDTGAARLRFVPGSNHKNLAGTVFGGYMASIIDDAAGIATWFGGGQRPFATSQISVSFLRAAQAKEPLIADVIVNFAGKRQAFVEVRVSREDGNEMVAIGNIVQSFLETKMRD
jgi:uncharacterized protein (TIGR00369 family)